MSGGARRSRAWVVRLRGVARSPPCAATGRAAARRAAARVVVDDFESTSRRGRAHPADGVALTARVRRRRARRARCASTSTSTRRRLRRRAQARSPSTCPANYAFTFRVRGECAAQQPRVQADRLDRRERVVVQRAATSRSRATGRRSPSRSGRSRSRGARRAAARSAHVAAIEFAVTAGSGGTGTVWLDDLELRAAAAAGRDAAARRWRRASSAAPGTRRGARARRRLARPCWAQRARRPRAVARARPRRRARVRRPRASTGRRGAHAARLRDRDLRRRRGVARRCARCAAATAAATTSYLPESEARCACGCACARAGAAGGVGDRARSRVQPLAWSATRERVLRGDRARRAARHLPARRCRGEQAYWTVVGAGRRPATRRCSARTARSRPGKAALLARAVPAGRTDALRDVGRRARPTQALARRRPADPDRALEPADRSTLDGDRVRDRRRAARPALVGALPGAQSRDATRARGDAVPRAAPVPGEPAGAVPEHAGRHGADPRSIALDGRIVRVERRRAAVVASHARPTAFGATTFDAGRRRRRLPARRARCRRATARRRTRSARASGALALSRSTWPPGAEREVDVVVPLHERARAPSPRTRRRRDAAVERGATQLDDRGATWRSRSTRVASRLPDAARSIARRCARSSATSWSTATAPAIQPGSRSYARSWIRDGALTSSALLRLGHADAVRDVHRVVRAVPVRRTARCRAASTGAAPIRCPSTTATASSSTWSPSTTATPAIARSVERMWPHVRAAAAYLDSLRHSAARRSGARRRSARFFGLLPPSISHEGYSAKPMHSYWDDFFALRGFKDAAFLAGALGHDATTRARCAAIRDEFAHDLAASVARGDGARTTSTTSPAAPTSATSTPPRRRSRSTPVRGRRRAAARRRCERTFERYWEFFDDRRDGREPWDAFTPYEMRNVGAFVRLGWRDRAQRSCSTGS